MEQRESTVSTGAKKFLKKEVIRGYFESDAESAFEFNPAEYDEKEFRDEYAAIISKASSDVIKNQEIIDDILKMEEMKNSNIFISPEHPYSDEMIRDISVALEVLNKRRNKYGLPELKLNLYSEEGDLGWYGKYYLSQFEGETQKKSLIDAYKRKVKIIRENKVAERDLNRLKSGLRDHGFKPEDLGITEEEMKEILK